MTLKLKLIPPKAAHAALWLTWRREEIALRHNPIVDCDLATLEARLERLNAPLSEHHDEYRWMVEADGEIVGTVSATGFSWNMGYCEIGYHLGSAWHGRGLGTRAVALLVDKLFTEGALRRLMAVIAADNVASQRLARRLGFVEEGRLGEHYLINGVPTDELIFALLKRNWAALKSA